jgi:hypothetical protein
MVARPYSSAASAGARGGGRGGGGGGRAAAAEGVTGEYWAALQAAVAARPVSRLRLLG